MDLGITLTDNKIKDITKAIKSLTDNKIEGITKVIKSQENIHQEKGGFFDDFFDPLMKMC